MSTSTAWSPIPRPNPKASRTIKFSSLPNEIVLKILKTIVLNDARLARLSTYDNSNETRTQDDIEVLYKTCKKLHFLMHEAVKVTNGTWRCDVEHGVNAVVDDGVVAIVREKMGSVEKGYRYKGSGDMVVFC
jgi:hypothetical protein